MMVSYSYEFSGMGEGLSSVRRFDHKKDTDMTFHVGLADEEVLRLAGRYVNTLVADMMDIGGAVLVADRCSPRTKDQTVIHVKLPLRNVEIFERSRVKEFLCSALHYYTNDHWEFEFVSHTVTKRIAERQRRFFARSENEGDVHVALFSGGADALSGLAHQLVNNPDAFFSLVTVGTSNTRMQGVQSVLATQLRHSEYGSRIQNIFIDTPRKYAKEIPLNGDFRARAFVFLFIGCAFAILEGQNKLFVYENGIGAINLPFRASEVGLDHSRTVHPMSLWKVSRLVSEIIGEMFCIENPFFFFTKTEVCNGLIRAGLEDLFQHSISCDRMRYDSKQCGNCSSCILRRIAAHNLGLPDTSYSLSNKWTHIRHMARQIETIQQSLDTQDPWHVLAKKFPSALIDVDVARPYMMPQLTETQMRRQVLEMYERYEEEWQLAITHFSSHEMMIGIDQDLTRNDSDRTTDE